MSRLRVSAILGSFVSLLPSLALSQSSNATVGGTLADGQ